MLGVLSTTVGFSDVLKQKSIPESVLESVSKPVSKSVQPTTLWWKSVLESAESQYRDEIAKSVASALAPEEEVPFWDWVNDDEPTAADLLSLYSDIEAF